MPCRTKSEIQVTMPAATPASAMRVQFMLPPLRAPRADGKRPDASVAPALSCGEYRGHYASVGGAVKAPELLGLHPDVATGWPRSMRRRPAR